MRLVITAALSLSFLVTSGRILADDAVSIDKLIDQVSDGVSKKKPEDAIKAIDELGKRGAEAKPAVGALIMALGSDDVEVKWHAIRTLGAIGSGALDAVPSLEKGLTDKETFVRAYSAYALGQIGKASEAAIQQLAKNAFDKESLVRRASLRAMQQLDPPETLVIEVVERILKDGDLAVIMAAMHSLAEQGKEGVPRIRKALQEVLKRDPATLADDDSKLPYYASMVLASMGPDAAAAVPELTEIVKRFQKDPDVRMQAILALGQIGEASKPAAPVLLEVLKTGKFEHVRYAAAYALGILKANGEAQEVFKAALDGDDEMLRTISAWALARSNPKDTDLVNRAVRLIVNGLKSKDVNVQRAAARAAVEFDIPPEIAGPALVEALENEDETVVANAIAALAAMGPRVLDHVEDALANEKLRHYALLLIAKLGPEASSAVPALTAVITEGPDPEDPESIEFVREAQLALGQIGPAARQAVRALVGSLSFDDERVQASACYALGKIGPTASRAIPALQKAAKSDRPLVKLAALRALLEIRPGQRDLMIIALPHLVKALDHENEYVRAEAATAIGQMGSFAKSRATAPLKKKLKDESQIVREAVAEALKQLEG
jgi:HEAT repeat protein